MIPCLATGADAAALLAGRPGRMIGQHCHVFVITHVRRCRTARPQDDASDREPDLDFTKDVKLAARNWRCRRRWGREEVNASFGCLRLRAQPHLGRVGGMRRRAKAARPSLDYSMKKTRSSRCNGRSRSGSTGVSRYSVIHACQRRLASLDARAFCAASQSSHSR